MLIRLRTIRDAQARGEAHGTSPLPARPTGTQVSAANGAE